MAEDWEDAIEQCQEIIRLIDEDVSERALDKASDFFEGVREKVADIEETITEHQHVTARQQQALDNMESGVRRWIRD